MRLSRIYETSLDTITNDFNDTFVVFYGVDTQNNLNIRDNLYTFFKNIIQQQEEYVILENTFVLTDEDYSLINFDDAISQRIDIAYKTLTLTKDITSEQKDRILKKVKEYIVKNQINFNTIPLIVAYGQFNKEDLLFLDLVKIMGATVIVFDLQKLNLEYWKQNGYLIYEGDFTYNGSIFDAIDSGILINSKSTDCKIHNDKIIDDYLNEGLYSREELAKCKSVGIHINASRFDIIPILKESASLREGFKFNKQENVVKIPCFCTLINGRHNYLEDYHKFIDEVINTTELDLLLKQSAEFTLNYKTNEDVDFNIINCYDLKENNAITVYFDKIFDLKIYKNDDLPLILQQNIIDTSLEVKDSLNLSIEDYKVLLSNLITLDNRFKHLLKTRDCSGKVPRIVVIDNFNIENKQYMYFMLTLSKLGIDVIFMSQKGVFNLENYLPSYMINIVTLDKFDKDNEMLLTYKDVGITKTINSIKYKLLNKINNR